MVYSIIESKLAGQDVEAIVKYMSQELHNGSAAREFLKDVATSYRNIGENPHMYGLCHNVHLSGGDYRKIPIKNYLILYRVAEEEKAVYIIRVIYGKRNYTVLV